MNPDPVHPTRDELFAYRDGELVAERRVVIEAHVAGCRVCRGTIDEMSRLEADLRSRPDDVGERYYERMTESVLKRVRTENRSPRYERRKPESSAAVEEESRAVPKIPWAAVLSTGSAAVAVLIVVVVLVREGVVMRSAPRPTLLEKSAPDAGTRARDSLAAGSPLAQAPGPPTAQTPVRPSARPPEESLALRKTALPPATSGLVAEPKAESQPPPAGEADRMAANEETKLRQQAAPPSATAPQQEIAGLKDQAKAAGLAANEPPAAGSDEYAALTRRYGLPPVWEEGRVSSESLERAEPGLRNLYRTGGAGMDSARVRLYLAEALRLRSGAHPDSADYEEIVHHYQRAIRLAAGDSAVANVASRRLAEFVKEAGPPPAPH